MVSRRKDNHNAGREPGMGISCACLGCVVACILTAMATGAPVQAGILLASAVAALFAKAYGHGWADLEASVCRRIGKMGPTMLIMWMIGFLMGSMLYSGLLPMLVYYGFTLISPRFLYVSALLACMLMSTMTGSSWSAAGTAGVACMALAHGHGADPGIMAGAVVAGSVFGDKISPMSETTNLAPACAGTDLYSHIKSQLWTTVPAICAAAAAFLALGTGLPVDTGAGAVPAQAASIMSELDGLYTWSPVLLLPVALLLILSFLKMPATPVMFACGCVNLVLGRTVQGLDWKYGLTACVTGFKAEFVSADPGALDSKVLYILNRGGMTSMVSIILICFCGFTLISILTHAGFMDAALAPMAHGLRTRTKAMLSAEAAILVLAGLGGVSYVSSVFVGEAWKKPFLKNGMGLSCLSRTLEDVGTCCTAVIPWCGSAVFFATTLDVPVWGAGGFAPYAFLPYLCPLAAFVLAVAGIGLRFDENEASSVLGDSCGAGAAGCEAAELEEAGAS